MKFVELGNTNGRTVIYFHGAPGSPDEISIFEKHAKKHDLHIICYDRFSLDSSLKNKSYYKQLASAVIDKANGGMVDIIGFSIGCHAAIETSLYLRGTVRELHLISAVAPLNAGDFIGGMAGKIVFSLAMKYPTIFALLSYWQSILVRTAPNLLFKMLFSSATGEDKILLRKTYFKPFINSVLLHCFTGNVKGYIREIEQYVTPWGNAIVNCGASTFIWHGTSDNWAPLGMSQYLKETITGPSHLELLSGLSHYSCLYAAAPRICEQLGKT